jgi:hypothetical protein
MPDQVFLKLLNCKTLTSTPSLDDINACISRNFVNLNNYYIICSGKVLVNDPPINSTLHIIPRVLGGKGGFGSKLKAQGRKKIEVSNSSCRDLDGNRLSTLKKNQELAIYLKKEAELEAEKEKAIDAKIAKGLKGFQPKKVHLDDTRLNNDMEESFDGVADAIQKAFARKTLHHSKGKAKLDLDQDEYKSSSDED